MKRFLTIVAFTMCLTEFAEGKPLTDYLGSIHGYTDASRVGRVVIGHWTFANNLRLCYL